MSRKQRRFNLNQLVTLRAKTVPSKKREASRRACRGKATVEEHGSTRGL